MAAVTSWKKYFPVKEQIENGYLPGHTSPAHKEKLRNGMERDGRFLKQ